MTLLRRYRWLGGLLLALLLGLLVWQRLQPPPMPAIPPGANARTQDAPDH